MIYDLIVKDSVDDLILRYHDEAGDLFRSLVEDPTRLISRRRS